MTEPTATSLPRPSLPLNVKVLGLVSLFNDVASEMVYPILPRFLLSVLHGNLIYLGVIEGMAESVASFLKLWSGSRSDRAGRRKGFVLFGYVLAVTIRPLIGLTIAPWQLFVVRVSDRFGKGVRTSPRDALIADSTEPALRGRAFGFHRAMDHLGAAIGPLLAFGFLWFWPDALRALFLVTIVPGVLVVLLLIFGLREPPASAAPAVVVPSVRRPLDANFRLLLVALTVFALGNSSDAFLLVRAQQLGVPVVWLPPLWCAFHVVKSLSNLLFGRAVDHWRRPRVFIFLGWFVYAGAYLGFGLAWSAWQAWACFLGYALFYGLTEPAEKTLVANLVGKEQKGHAFGWYHFAMGIVALPASLIFGTIYELYGPMSAFGLGAGLAGVAALLFMGVADAASERAPRAV